MGATAVLYVHAAASYRALLDFSPLVSGCVNSVRRNI